jgi:hypothetical protein
MATTKIKTNPMLMRSRSRLLAGLIVTPTSLLSVVVILASNSYPLLALMPLPTLMLGTAMITLELRNWIST